MEYRSHTKELKFLLVIILLWVLVTIVGPGYYPFNWQAIKVDLVIEGAIGIAIYFYYGLTNYDFKLTENALIVRNRFPLFRRENQFALKDIDKIYFREDSFINLFSEYKYVIIQSTDEHWQAKQYRFHCHGLEYDSNGENTNLPTYEDFHLSLKKRGIEIDWV